MLVLGLDVGRENDPAAMALLRRTGSRPYGSHRPHWTVEHAANLPLGTDYTDIAEWSATLAGDLAEAGYDTHLAVDATGIGQAVVELARRNRPDLPLHAVTITGGHRLTARGARAYSVGKHRLTEVLQVALEHDGITLPSGHSELRNQLLAFSRRPTRSGYVRHEANQGHDDLVLAVELALWLGDALHDASAGVSA